MKRPEVFIRVFKANTEADLPTTGKIYSYSIQVSDLEISETRDGIECSFTTVGKEYYFETGNVLDIKLGYANMNKTQLPPMIITSVNLTYDYKITVTAMDEFQYHSVYTNLIPINPRPDQKEFIDSYLKSTSTDNTIKLKQMLGYIKSLLVGKMFYWSTNDNSINFNSNGMFKIDEFVDIDSNIGAWDSQVYVKIKQILDLLKSHFKLQCFMTSSSENITDEYVHSVYVANVNSSINHLSYYNFPFVDNINIISDSLIYNDPSLSKKAVRGVFIYKNKDDKEDTNTTYMYAYYDQNNELKTVTSLPEGYVFDEFKIQDSYSYSDDQKKEWVTNRLKASEYVGYKGSIQSFNYNMNVFDVAKLIFNNTDRTNGIFAVLAITRTYSDSGIFIELNVKEKIANE